MLHLACTRFTEKTLAENERYRELHKIQGCIYGTPCPINETYPINSLIFVVEMNNSTNRIHGIGLIKNRIITHERHNIYEYTGDSYNFNRYVYKGDHWISRDMLAFSEPDVVQQLEAFLFFGKSHQKRRLGITMLKKIMTSREQGWLKKIRNVFLEKIEEERFMNSSSTSSSSSCTAQ